MNREIKFRAWWNGIEYYVSTVDIPNDNRGAHNFKGYEKNAGYILRKVKNHPFANSRGYVLEHRLVMESNLGRFLNKDEVVHHIDGKRDNNEIANLDIIINQSSHATIEDRGKRNPNGRFIATDPIFENIKFRLFDKDRQITKIYSLSKLINTTFRKGCFEFRGRFTGLHDKNGKEIYEGDIISRLRHSEPSNWASPMIHKRGFERIVKFERGMFVGDDNSCPLSNEVKFNSLVVEDYEVIGNIFENEELIQENHEKAE